MTLTPLVFPPPVYVDHMMTCLVSAKWRWPKACHLFVDTTTDLDVLHDFAKRIGLKRAWFQNTAMPHYDLNERRRSAAMAHGAIELDRRDTVMVLRRWRALTAPRPQHGRAVTQ